MFISKMWIREYSNLFQLKEPLVLGDGFVDKVKLPDAGLETPAGTDGIVTGWGATFVRLKNEPFKYL